MRGFLSSAICVATIAIVGCGSGGDSASSSRAPTSQGSAPAPAGLPKGCRPEEVKTLLTGFIGAINSSSRRRSAQYVAEAPELTRFTLYRGPGPGEGRLSPETAAEVYRDMTKLTRGEDFDFVGAAVGRAAPLASERLGPNASDPAAGADLVFASKHRVIAGKVGINCATGHIYTGAMGAKAGEVPTPCVGGRPRLHSAEPVVCAYTY